MRVKFLNFPHCVIRSKSSNKKDQIKRLPSSGSFDVGPSENVISAKDGGLILGEELLFKPADIKDELFDDDTAETLSSSFTPENTKKNRSFTRFITYYEHSVEKYYKTLFLRKKRHFSVKTTFLLK